MSDAELLAVLLAEPRDPQQIAIACAHARHRSLTGPVQSALSGRCGDVPERKEAAGRPEATGRLSTLAGT